MVVLHKSDKVKERQIVDNNGGHSSFTDSWSGYSRRIRRKLLHSSSVWRGSKHKWLQYADGNEYPF